MKALIFAAGLGTRLKPFTESHPKALFPINGKPLLERNIQYLQSFGIQDFVINVHHFADQIIEFLASNNHFGANIFVSDETNLLFETGGGLVFAKKYLQDETFLIMNADILTNLNLHKMIEHHQSNTAMVTLAVSDRESSRKFAFDEQLRLAGWKNFKTQETIGRTDAVKYLGFSGVHVMEPEIFKYLPSEPTKFSITKSYLELMKKIAIQGYNHTGDNWVDVGKPESKRIAEKMFL